MLNSIHLPASPHDQLLVPSVYLDEHADPRWFTRAIASDPTNAMRYHGALLEVFTNQHLPFVLRESALKQDVSQTTLSRYSLLPLYPNGSFHRGIPAREWHYREHAGKSYSLYLDAENAFTLAYKGIPQMIVGFERSGVSILKIEQLQLVHPYVQTSGNTFRRPGPDALYRFEIDLVKRNLIEAWALFNNCDHVLVVSSSSQRAVVDPTSAITASDASKMYDDPFLKCGYSYREYGGRGYYYRRLITE